MQQNHSRYIYLLSAGHLFTGMNQGALPTIPPFLTAAYHFNYAEVTTLVLTSAVVSFTIQSVFRNLTDKAPRSWMIAIDVLLAGGGMAVAGLLSDFRLLFVSVMIGGVGVAAFHPEGARMANKVSGEEKGTGVSIFSFGGNAGFAVGLILATVSISLFGLKGTAILAVPYVLMAITILPQIRKMNQVPSEQGSSEIIPEKPAEPDRWVPFTLFNLLLFGRSIVFCELNTFLPLFSIQVLQQFESIGSILLSFYFIIGVASVLIGGRLGDRFGSVRITRIDFILPPSALAALAMVRATMPAVLLLIPVVYALYPPSSLTVVSGQKYLPNCMGLASRITLGLSVSIGGMVAPFLGHLADKFGLMATTYAITAISIIPAVMSYTLPKEDKREKVVRNSHS